MHEMGFIKGYPDGTFKPKNYITSGEFCTLLFRMLDIDVPQNEPNEHWAYPSAVVAKNFLSYNGEIDLSSKALNTPIKRGIGFKIAMRAAGYRYPTEIKYLDNPFIDINKNESPSRWYGTYMLNGYYLGIINGISKNMMNPDGYMTRAEACKILFNVYFNRDILSDPTCIVAPNIIEQLDCKFIGDDSYTYYNDIAYVVLSFPKNIIDSFAETGLKIIITNEDASKYYTGASGVGSIGGLYSSSINTIVCFTKNKVENPLYAFTGSMRHEIGHFIYSYVLTPEEVALVEESFNSEEVNTFSKITYSDYCKTNSEEYFSEVIKCYYYSRYRDSLINADLDKINSVVTKYINFN